MSADELNWQIKKQKLDRRFQEYRRAKLERNRPAMDNAQDAMMDEYVVGEPFAERVKEIIERAFGIDLD